MFDQLKQAMEKKAMSDKKENNLSNDSEVEPGQYDNLGETAKEVDLTKRYKDWDDGFTVPDDKTKNDKDE